MYSHLAERHKRCFSNTLALYLKLLFPQPLVVVLSFLLLIYESLCVQFFFFFIVYSLSMVSGLKGAHRSMGCLTYSLRFLSPAANKPLTIHPLTPPAGTDRRTSRHVTALHNTHGRSSSHQATSHFLLSCRLPRWTIATGNGPEEKEEDREKGGESGRRCE